MRLETELAGVSEASPTVRWGKLGQLDVLVDERLVFSKKTVGRMPHPGELAGLIRAQRR